MFYVKTLDNITTNADFAPGSRCMNKRDQNIKYHLVSHKSCASHEKA